MPTRWAALRAASHRTAPGHPARTRTLQAHRSRGRQSHAYAASLEYAVVRKPSRVDVHVRLPIVVALLEIPHHRGDSASSASSCASSRPDPPLGRSACPCPLTRQSRCPVARHVAHPPRGVLRRVVADDRPIRPPADRTPRRAQRMRAGPRGTRHYAPPASAATMASSTSPPSSSRTAASSAS